MSSIRTFIDKSDNVLRIPNTHNEEKRKSKTKKSPKRTIQKIIKKNNIKRRRIFVQPVTRSATEPTAYKPDSVYSRQNEDAQTTEANSRRRGKKSSKVLRYHMPFQKLQPRSRRNKRRVQESGTRNVETDPLRNKRDAETDNNVMILKDLDEIEFVESDKDHNLIRAHVQNYW